MKIIPRCRFSTLFYLFVSAFLQQILFFDSFASDEVLRIDAYPKNSTDTIGQVFGETLEEKFLQPNIPLLDANGNEVNLKDFRGNFIILYFWATWCNLCVQEMQSLSKMVNKLEFMDVKDVLIMPVSIDFKNAKFITDFLKNNHLAKFPVLVDSSKQLMNSLNVKSLPTTFLINKDGYIIQAFETHLNWDDKQIIDSLIKIKGKNTNSKPNLKNSEINSDKKSDDTKSKKDIINQKPVKKSPTLIY